MIRVFFALCLLSITSLSCLYSAAISPTPLQTAQPPSKSFILQDHPAAAPTPIRSALVTASRSVNIRAGASEHFADVGDLWHGARVIILDCQQGWAKTPEGWVKGIYLGGICQHD